MISPGIGLSGCVIHWTLFYGKRFRWIIGVQGRIGGIREADYKLIADGGGADSKWCRKETDWTEQGLKK